MPTFLPRLLLGALDRSTRGLAADVAGLDQPGRPPDWSRAAADSTREFNPQTAAAEPFLSRVPAHTEPFGAG